jgi:vesicle coat complex subunit
MSYIPIPVVTDALSDNLRHALKDRDAYVRKTAAICVAKLYAADPRRAEKGGFVELLRDLMLDSNATVVANAVASLSEIGDRQDGVIFRLNYQTANKLLAALPESSECVRKFAIVILADILIPDGVKSTSWTPYYAIPQNVTRMRKHLRSVLSFSFNTRTLPWFSQQLKLYCSL